MHALDAELKELVVAARLPAKLGGNILAEAIEAMDRYPEDPGSAALYDQQQSALLGTLISNPMEAVKEAAAVISLMRDRNPELVDEFMQHGGFRAASSIANLAQHYRRLMARGDMAAARGARN